MKIEQKLKVVLSILVIILISLVSFGGIYIQKAKNVENIIPEYKLGMDLQGGRMVGLVVDDTVNTVIYDKDGKVVEKEGKDTTKKEEPINPKETLTTENYEKTKEIITKRLNDMQVIDYTIRYDEKTGKILLQLPEDSDTDLIAQYMVIRGVFTVTGDEDQVLLNNSHIKKAQVGYNTTENGTTVYLNINLNEEGTQIFKDITNTYVKSTDEEGKDNSKKIALKIDDSTLLNTYFESEISSGIIQMSIGSSSTDSSAIQSYVQEASNIAVLLNNGSLPLTYTIEENRYVMSDITEDMLYIPVLAIGGTALLIGIVFLIIKYRKNGFLAGVSLIGYIATLLVVLRYTNVVLTVEGLIGIAIAIIMNYVFTVYLLHLIKLSDAKTFTGVVNSFKDSILKTLLIFVPVAVTAVVLSFAGWLPVYSFGMVMFWGLLTSALYNLIITRTLIVNTVRSK